jgi:hypothetical protein
MEEQMTISAQNDEVTIQLSATSNVGSMVDMKCAFGRACLAAELGSAQRIFTCPLPFFGLEVVAIWHVHKLMLPCCVRLTLSCMLFSGFFQPLIDASAAFRCAILAFGIPLLSIVIVEKAGCGGIGRYLDWAIANVALKANNDSVTRFLGERLSATSKVNPFSNLGRRHSAFPIKVAKAGLSDGNRFHAAPCPSCLGGFGKCIHSVGGEGKLWS